ncbi:MAG TPA: hypothetical protein VN828_22900, partial [Acidobacteriaceae bacterium]|nr:hypothetical protein [Acidobacteriaceae bacterium]
LGSHGEIFVTDGNPDGPESPALLLRIDLHTGKQWVVSRGGFLRYPGGIAMLNESTVLIADAAAVKSSPRIVRVNLKSGAQSIVASGPPLVRPSAVLVTGRQ